jgi:hypothetical protein
MEKNIPTGRSCLVIITGSLWAESRKVPKAFFTSLAEMVFMCMVPLVRKYIVAIITTFKFCQCKILGHFLGSQLILIIQIIGISGVKKTPEHRAVF